MNSEPTSAGPVTLTAFPTPSQVATGGVMPQPPMRRGRKRSKGEASRLERAAIAAGFSTMSARAFVASDELGEIMSDVGVLAISRGKLALAQHHIERLMAFLQEKAADCTDPAEIRKYCELQRKLADSLIASCAEMAKNARKVVVNQPALNQARPNFPSFGVQVNVNQKPGTPPQPVLTSP